MSENNQTQQLLAEATKWLLEQELLNNPFMKNSLILNTLKVDPSITDVEYIIDNNGKKILIFLELKWFARLFRKHKIGNEVLEMLREALPSYGVRVIFSRELFNKTLERAKNYASSPERVPNENPIDDAGSNQSSGE